MMNFDISLPDIFEASRRKRQALSIAFYASHAFTRYCAKDFDE